MIAERSVLKEWNVVTLGEIAEIKTGPFGSALHQKDYVAHGTPIITVEHLGERGVEHINLPMVSDFDRRRLGAYALKKGDIVFSRVGSIDRNALIRNSEEGWLFSGRLLRVRANPQTVFPAFLSHLFHGEEFRFLVRNVAVGQTMPSLNTKLLASISVSLPPVDEQRAIAEALGDVDELIGILERLIAKKLDIKQAVMQQLLTGKTRLPGFTGEWKTKPLRTFVRQFTVPMRDKPTKLDGPIPWCRIEDFDGMYLHGSKSGQGVSTHTIEAMNLKVYPEGTLLVSCSADLGRCAIVARPLVSNQTFIGLEIDRDTASSVFFYYLMTSCAKALNDLSSGTTISYLSREQFETFQVTAPLDLNEQVAIANVLSDMDCEIESLNQRLAKTRNIKQGMMQQLLTGKVRLV